MSRLYWSLVLCVSICFAATASSFGANASVIRPEKLRCEYLVNPLGLDVPQPRLDWTLEAGIPTPRNLNQASYHILVASTPELLAHDKGDLWDSGEVKSNDTAHIVYAGAPLVSREACFWKVRVTDSTGKVSGWSQPASWEMGLLKPEDWSAKWIDAGPVTQEAKPGKIAIVKATYEALDESGLADVTPVLSGLLKDNALSVEVTNEALGTDPALHHHKQLRVEYALDGKKMETVVYEKATLALPEQRQSLPLLVKRFTLHKPVVKARLYVTALGLYEIALNDKRIGTQIFAPDWTDYNKRVRYQVYDVMPLMQSVDNELTAMVGNGWYCGHIGNGGFQAWGTTPALFAQLELTYADGSTERIVSDGYWVKYAGPITSSDFMLGENYDARQVEQEWKPLKADLSKGTAVVERTEPSRPLNAQVDQQVQAIGELHPKSIKQAKPGHWIFDMGQNMVGFVRLKVTVPEGTRITIRHAEMINGDGTLYTDNLRGAPSVDTYICKGDGVETWQPNFTFHGFRYVELSGMPKAPGKNAVTGIVVGTAIPPTGEFTCSDAAINQLQSNIQWGMRGNYLSVPTDCPQRDERMGWMGDAQVFIRTAAYNGNVAAFFTKWLVDVDDAQMDDGQFTNVSPAPTSKWSKGGGPAWSDAGVICPWTIYLMYDDKRILEQHLPAMKRWIDWCQAHSTGLIRDHDRGPDYGDWLSQGESTSKELIGTAYFAYSTALVAKSCAVVNDPDEAKYQQLADQIKSAFVQHYVTANGRIQGDTQASYAMALRFGLLPDDLRPKAAQYLDENVKAHGNHLTTGFVGVSYLLPALTSQNKIATAYDLLFQDTFPSWLFSVKQGATTIWERWDGWTPDKGFQNPSMNSFNHYSLGSCGEWMYDTIAGIGVDPDQPGFQHIIIHPRPSAKLTKAEGHFASIHGEISTKWTLEKGTFSLLVTVPVNATAEIILPGIQRVSSQPALKPDGIADGSTRFAVGSGDYHFTCQVP